MTRRVLRVLQATMLMAAAGPWAARAQQDPLQGLNGKVREKTGGMFGFTFEERTRWEEKDGVNFGRAVNQQDVLTRLRFGMWVRPTSWLTFHIMGQDARAPLYGVPAPNTIRDTADLHEGYFELGKSHGLGASLGVAFQLSLVEHLALEDPDLDADHAIGGV